VPERAAPYVIGRGESRRTDALLPFKACAADTDGAMSFCEFTLGPWHMGPVLHVHTSVDEALYVVSGTLLTQLGEQRSEAGAGAFVWMPRGVGHAFSNAGPDPVHVLAVSVPGGFEELFAEQAAYFASLQGQAPDPAVLDDIGGRHGALTLGPPIRADGAPGPASP
jgi:mannose-6-phosphate isomerase-like protein (cupin superfamily)